MNTAIVIQTPVCSWCGEGGSIQIDSESYNNWKNGMLLQDAMPHLIAPYREQLKTGIHPDCWNAMFGGFDD